MTNKIKKPQGFAHMKQYNPERLMEVARKGGQSVNPDNRAFSRDRDLAKEAGRAGGLASQRAKALA